MNESLSNLAAVYAANTQMSTNAIVNLASDISNIYSILNATNYKSELYVEIQVIGSRINATAYDAELLSQAAMELSAMAAESLEISKKAEALFSDTKSVRERLTGIVDQLIKFESLIVRKKAVNPLIAGDLITLVHSAVSDGINAKLLIELAFKSINTLVAAFQNN
ncbi:hypothetical protein [Mucilaginibacter sp.]|jgi:hypothetical protein|uniref:hypothetical protein n=1 Tax=Mucilaginibacter sp. TaxID=1882438 RepID=UPI00356B0FF1